MMETLPRIQSKETVDEKNKLKLRSKITAKMKHILVEKGWILYIVGFLLGRAIILSSVSPFTVAFLATLWLVQRHNLFKTILAMLIGGFTVSISQGAHIGITLISFLFLANLFYKGNKQQIFIPIFVFLSTGISRLFLFSISGKLTHYDWMFLIVEGFLGAVLVLIFMQCIPLLSPKRYKTTLTNEEIVCIIILLASVLTGMIGWDIYNASIEQIFSRYLVLLLAFIGGAAIGSTVGVVAGLILSLANVVNLYQIGLLAFSGLLGGLLKEGRKLGVSIGLLVGTLLVGLYGDTIHFIPFLLESLFAICLFLITPANWIKKISRYIPGTEEYTMEQEQYLQKVRNITAKRVEEFSGVFEALSKSFLTNDVSLDDELDTKQETDIFLSRITEKTCQLCFMKQRCWQNQFDQTYSFMEDLKDDYIRQQEPSPRVKKQFENYCIKSKKVMHKMEEELTYFEANRKLKQQVLKSKRLVAEQLQGVSEVMEDFAVEIMKERKQHEKQEEQIFYSLHQMGLEVEKLDIFRLEKGNVDIEMTLVFSNYHGEASKLIAPALSEILNETIEVKEKEISPFPHGSSFIKFGSARSFVVTTGMAYAAKGGGLISGDSHTTIELGKGKFALAISDGMGNGKRAKEESSESLRLLHKILQTGIPEKVAIKTINSILALRTTEEMFATLDLAIINLHNAFVQFLKIGSSPTYIKRGNTIKKLEVANLPMGIIQEFDVDMIGEQLHSGDILIMMSDGIYEGPKGIEDNDRWVQQTISEMETDDSQEIADLLLEEVVRFQNGAIEDDMTVLVAKVDKYIPKWSPIPTLYKEVL
ncbi:stage II sporulation protein E [Cerasibacillus terrae]|uniref:Stage II sporulation protein E n=1 Tax=Cerasibacillus terrae TaxID=2498845 RepID=A0A5C8NQN9_9BACI|nr:stage II sporulation protein E [Cerasibacillus terrae]TXL63456.1 stage II sporulation protein E [Cerasibacillus terrae]